MRLEEVRELVGDERIELLTDLFDGDTGERVQDDGARHVSHLFDAEHPVDTGAERGAEQDRFRTPFQMQHDILPCHQCFAGKVQDLIQIFWFCHREHLLLAVGKEPLHGVVHLDPCPAQIADGFGAVEGTQSDHNSPRMASVICVAT